MNEKHEPTTNDIRFDSTTTATLILIQIKGFILDDTFIVCLTLKASPQFKLGYHVDISPYIFKKHSIFTSFVKMWQLDVDSLIYYKHFLNQIIWINFSHAFPRSFISKHIVVLWFPTLDTYKYMFKWVIAATKTCRVMFKSLLSKLSPLISCHHRIHPNIQLHPTLRIRYHSWIAHYPSQVRDLWPNIYACCWNISCE